MNNPFTRATIHSSNENAKVRENQKVSNQVSQKYFHNQVQKVEHPLYLEKITTILQEQSKQPPVSEKYISKLLFNKEKLGELAKSITEAQQSMSFNRKIPALTAEEVQEIYRSVNRQRVAKSREKKKEEMRKVNYESANADFEKLFQESLARDFKPPLPSSKTPLSSKSSENKTYKRVGKRQFKPSDIKL